MTIEETKQLDAIIATLPPTLTPYSKHIRSLIIGMIARGEGSLGILTCDEGVRQLEFLSNETCLYTNLEYDARVASGLPVDDFIPELGALPEVNFRQVNEPELFRASCGDEQSNWNTNHLKEVRS